MNSLKEKLSKKLGPFPAVVWVGILVVGILVYRWYSNRNGSADTATVDTSNLDTGLTPSASDGATDTGGFGTGIPDAPGAGDLIFSDPVTSRDSLPFVPGKIKPPAGSEGSGTQTPTDGPKAPPTSKPGFWWGNQFITSGAQLVAFEHAHGNSTFSLPLWAYNHPAAAKKIGVPVPAKKPTVASGSKPAPIKNPSSNKKPAIPVETGGHDQQHGIRPSMLPPGLAPIAPLSHPLSPSLAPGSGLERVPEHSPGLTRGVQAP